VPIIATSPEPMAAARLGQMVTLSPRRLAEQPLRARAASSRPAYSLGTVSDSESGSRTLTRTFNRL
jgi:hypothetical protein